MAINTAINAPAPSRVPWSERLDRAQSALTSMRTKAREAAAAKPINAALNAGSTVATYYGLRYVKKNAPNRYHASVARMSRVTLPCVTTQPFGRPVEPDV